MGSFFNQPTVEGLAEALQSRPADPARDPARIARLLQMVEELSDDAVETLRPETGPVPPSLSREQPVGAGNRREERAFAAPAVLPASVTIASVVFRTCNRPDVLRRGLESYLENCLRHGRSNDFVVMDDSTSPAIRRDCRDMLSELKRRYGVEVLYAGLEEKQQFARRLIEIGGLPEEIVQFALFDVEQCGYSYGANNNAVLLHTSGDAVFVTDDDMQCRFATAPVVREGFRFSSCTDPQELWVFPDREAAMRSAAAAEKDILSSHGQFLGQVPAGLIAPGSEADYREASPDLLRKLATGGRIRITVNGLVGDCGWGMPFGYWNKTYGYLALEGPSHERLVRSATDYRAACTSRDILSVVDRATITDRFSFLFGSLGLDNRTLLPPVSPVFRGQDLIFATTAEKCLAESFLAYLPWALLHAPLEHRKFWPGEVVRGGSGIDLCRILIECIQSFEPGAVQRDVGLRLRGLGQYLTEHGTQPTAKFEAFLRERLARSNDRLISLLEGRLQSSGGLPEFWANDVKKYLAILRQASAREDYCIPLDLVVGRSRTETRELTRRLVFKFGQLLYSWPEMVEAAGRLRSGGERLAQPV